MHKSYLNSINNIVLPYKPSRAIGLFLMVLFVFMTSNVLNAQIASSTWALTANGNPANVGNVTGTEMAFGSGLNSPSYSTTVGVTTGSWSNDAGSLRNDEYYEFEVTPNANTVFNVTAINFEHSRSNGDWLVRAYYSTDNFATSMPIANAFSSNSSSPTSNNNTVNIEVENTTLKVRIYGWESDANNRSLRIRNFVISGTTCTKPSAAGTITGTTAVCQGANSITYSVPAITNATGYTWTLPAGATIVSGANTRTITVNYSLSAISGNVTVQGTNSCGSGTVSSAFVVTVNTAPTVTASASPTSVASGGNVTLTASVTTPTTQNTVLLSEDFNGATNTWTKINNSTGGTTANAAWTLRPNGYVYNYPGYPVNTFNSNDNSQFYLTNSAAQGSGSTTSTILQSPVMNTVGYSSLSLEFFQYFLNWDTNDYGRVEVSTNGSSWTTVSTITTTQGAENDFLQTTVNLNSYINQNTLYIRFKYDARFDWFWAIDNVTVSGNKTIPYTYSWTASPSGTAGFPSGAGTASTSNNSIVASPTANTAYTVTAINPVSGCTGTSVVNVSVLGPTITSISTSAGCVGSTITINGTNLSGATAANVRIGGTAVTSITSNTSTQIVAVVGNGTTGLVTVTISGNTATSASSYTVYPASVGGTVSGGSNICAGSTSALLTLTGHTGTVVKWQSAVSPFSTWSDIASTATTYTSGALAATTQFRAVVQNGSCVTANSSATTVTVNNAPTITPNKVDETCPVSNNGTISPVVSGGLSNVRYIKLTQKYASWQQVAEIQAFEIFTGTNVALSSGGAVASASSVYSTDYPASEVNDNVPATNGNMWHSFTSNINEYVQIDLQSAKKIDYLRIFNRTDCCQERGQNMLLELFDASNTLVYSRTIDLYQSGANVPVTVNVLDVTWADGVTTLNRTALDSGNYTLNYADALGCTVSSLVNISSTNPASVGGTVSGGSTPICQGSSIGTLTLSGHTGTVVNWEKQLNGGGWNWAGGSATTFSEIPYAAGTWEYRAVVQSGSCTVAYSSIRTIVVNSTPVGGGIYSGNTTICINTTTGSMNVTGYTGSVVRWEKRLLPSVTWTSITNTTASYSESPNTAGTWEYRAVIGSGSCTEVYSTVRSVTVNAASVGGTVSGGTTPICQGSSTGTLTLSGHTGTVINWEKRLNGGSWGYAGGSSTTFSDNPAGGTWDYRALVQSGSCTSAYSSIRTIVVSPTPVGGGVYSGNTPICLNSSTGNMTLGGGYVGNVVRWEKRLLPSATWTTIANTTTVYSENPSVAGTWEYRAVVGSGSCATVNSSAFSVTVNPALTITLTNTNATVCQNTTTASFAYSATTGAPAACVVDFDSTANAAGFGDLSYVGLGSAPNTFSVNVPWDAAAGVYNATLTLKTDWPSCTSTVSYPITVTVGVSTPIVGARTHLNCATASGSVVLSGLPFPGTLFQTGQAIASYPITGTSMTVSGLAAGTYQFSASNGTCTSSATGNVVINSFVTNTWTAGGWSQGTPPTADQKIVFAANYSSTGNITACSCMVTSGAVTFNSNHTLILTNDLTVTPAGSLTFENRSSLVQINDVTNSGNITYKRTTSSVLTSDYTYWSSPVANQNLNISPSYASGMFYSYDDLAVPEDWKSETASTPMLVGKGYIIRGPQVTLPPPPGLYNAAFVGVPNNGTKTIAIGPTGTSNLLGNPYPSAIDADKFLAANSTRIEGTIYLWTHNTAIQLASNITSGTPGSGVLAYTSDDYASYNVTGGVGTGTGNFENGVEEVDNKPTGKIAAGQAFFTTSLGAGTVTFNNAMRLGSGGTVLDNDQFFKIKNPKLKTAKEIEKHRVWLNLTNSEGAFKQTLVGYITDATNDYDSRFDGQSFDANEFVDFYSINQENNLVIQGRALPFDEKDEVPLGFKTTIDGTFSISIDKVDGLLINQTVFLEDKLTNTVFDLKSGNYTFKTTAGTFDDRFVLKYKNTSNTLNVDETDKVDGILVLYSNNYKTLIVQNKIVDATVNSVSLFNMAGQSIAVWNFKEWEEQTNIQIPIRNLSSGIYIVKVQTTKGESNKKIVVN